MQSSWQYRTARNKYGKYCVPVASQHRKAAQKIIHQKVYEPRTIKFIQDHCGEGDVIHAGTYFGDFLPGLSQGLSAHAKIWAFEPNPENFYCAQKTIEINSLMNVNIHHAGLGAFRSQHYLQVTDQKGASLGGGSHITTEGNSIDGEKIQVDVVSIDLAVPQERSVSIIHLDVEGYEELALRGAMKCIQKWKPILILEDNKQITKHAWFKENILAHGYIRRPNLHSNKVFSISL